MKKQINGFNSYIGFLQDVRFIQWRLTQTDELNRYWDDFIKKNPEYKDQFDLAIEKFNAIRINDYKLPEEKQEELYQKILTNAQPNNTSKHRIIYYLAAACIVLFVIFNAVFILQRKSITDEKEHVSINGDAIIGKPLPPAEIQLITEGDIINLDQDAEIYLSENGFAHLGGENSQETNLELSKDKMNKLIVPWGKRSTIQLADGTKVWLNSGTELHFPSEFKGNTRNIHIKGEIYIEVAYLENNPFYVHTSAFDVQVYGTKFNIYAYEDNINRSIVLVEGKVEVKTAKEKTFLAPDEMLSLYDQQLSIEKVNVSQYISWKDGVLLFNKASVSEILTKIGRYYNVKFDYATNDQVLSKTCTGKLFLSENLDDVMSSLSVLSSTLFYREGEIIFIKNQ